MIVIIIYKQLDLLYIERIDQRNPHTRNLGFIIEPPLVRPKSDNEEDVGRNVAWQSIARMKEK